MPKPALLALLLLAATTATTARPGPVPVPVSMPMSMPAAGAVPASGAAPCGAFRQQLRATYGFHPAGLVEPERTTRARQMDAVWQAVHADPAALVPCLKAALAEPTEDTWFLFDGGQLLMSVAPTAEARAAMLTGLRRVSLDDVDLRTWVQLAADLGVAGMDTAPLGERWATYPKAKAVYYLPEHAAYEVTRDNGVLFIFGAMDERFATPALVRLSQAADPDVRSDAAMMLMSQATPAALRALTQVDPKGLSRQATESRRGLLGQPTLLVPRQPPKVTRARFLDAFRAILKDDPAPFDQLNSGVPDSERDMVAVLTPADLDLLRQVRRRYAAHTNQHGIEDYNIFTTVLMTLVWTPELVGRARP